MMAMAVRVVVARNSIEATSQTSLDPWGCFVAMKGLVLEPLAMPPVQPPLQPLGLPSPWCGKPCLMRPLSLLLLGVIYTNEGIIVIECTFCVFTDNEGNIWFVMHVNFLEVVSVEAVRGKNPFLTGVCTKLEYLQGKVVECYAALLLMIAMSSDVACAGDFAWPCPSGCGYAHTSVMWHAPCFQVLVMKGAAMLAARKSSVYQKPTVLCYDDISVFLMVDDGELVTCSIGNFFGLKVNDEWMLRCNDDLLVFPKVDGGDLVCNDGNFSGLKVKDEWMLRCNDDLLVFPKVDGGELVMCSDGNFSGLKVKDAWMVRSIDDISVFLVLKDLIYLVVFPPTERVLARIYFLVWQSFSVVHVDNFECAEVAAELRFESTRSVSRALRRCQKGPLIPRERKMWMEERKRKERRKRRGRRRKKRRKKKGSWPLLW